MRRPLEERLRNYYSMPALFDQVEEFLEKDSKPGADRTYARARFAAGQASATSAMPMPNSPPRPIPATVR